MKTKIIGALLFIFSILTTYVYANPVDSVELTDFDTSTVTVSGSAEEYSAGKEIFILFTSLDTPEGNNGMYSYEDSYIYQTTADENGKYQLSFSFDGKKGEYYTYVTNMQKAYGPFKFIPKDEVIAFVDSMTKGNIPENRIFEELKEYSNSLGCNVEYFTDSKSQDYLVRKLISKRNTITAQTIKNFVNEAGQELRFFDELKKTSTVAAVNTVIQKYKTVIAIDLSEYDTISTSRKNNVCRLLMNKSDNDAIYGSIENFNSELSAMIKSSTEQGGGGNSGGTGGSGPRLPDTSLRNDEVSNSNNENIFSDITDEFAWARDAISALYRDKVISGNEHGKFEPEKNVTRAQFIKMMALAFGFDSSEIKLAFNDVSANDWFYPYVAGAYAKGIVTGISKEQFGANDNITRQDMAVMVYRAMNSPKVNSDKIMFNDYTDISSYAKDAVGCMVSTGIINGFENNEFLPNSFATRAQAAKIIYKAKGVMAQ